MRLGLPLGLALGALASSCSTTPVVNGALRVRVTVRPGLASRCATVVVRSGSATQSTAAMPLKGQTLLVVGVLRGDLPETVTVQAVGYSDDACTTPTVPAEASAATEAVFGAGITVVELTLGATSSDGGVDADGDGSFTPDDCDDTNAAIHPGAAEVCSGGVDDDCDQAVDCADSQCAAQACATGAVCAGGTCTESACNNAQDDDGDTLVDCVDPDCTGRVCSVSMGLCALSVCQSPDEVGLCFDGVDNDADTLIDCADPDCVGSLCSDQNACTENDVCVGNQCQSGAAKVCPAPPSQCLNAPGVCQPAAAGVCEYPVRVGGCDDGLACTTSDACLVDGGCGGAVTLCNTPPAQCFAATGACSEQLDGGCVYAPAAQGTGCDDSNTCTVGDTCAGDGGCTGTDVRPSCVVPGECFAVATLCEVDGGCRFDPRVGQACDGGTCNAAGACQSLSFPYTPSNFLPQDVPATAGAMTFNCGVTVLNTGVVGGGIAFTNNCPGNAVAPAFTALPVGALQAVLLHVDSLTIDASNALRVVGDRPLIIAVGQGVTIAGLLNASSTPTALGPGAGQDCAVGGGTAGGTGGNPESGGGGGGAGFGVNGTNGSAGGGASGTGGARGDAMVGPTLIPLRGGCHGGNGGRAPGTGPGNGGRGGGALQLSAVGAVTVLSGGTIAAAGGGGIGGTEDQRIGGGGGGSGGAVLLEGASIAIASTGAVTANGGGGAEGSGYNTTFYGDDGDDGALRSGNRAAGGNRGVCGGNGGNGGAAAGNPQNPGAPECGTNMGGGGGGGAQGRIRFNASGGCTINGAAIISPDRTGSGGGCN